MWNKIASLLVLTFLAVIYDVVFVMNVWTFPFYVLSGWLVVFGLTLWITKSFWYAVAATIAMAALEDFLFILLRNLFTGVPVWQMYCHGWVKDVLPPLTQIFSWNWWGFPSGYFLQPAIAGVILLLKAKR